MSDFVVLQRAEGNVFGPMTVEIEGGVVSSGTAGAVFDNDGGLLRISELQVVDLTATAMVATANNGASFLEESNISRKYNVDGFRCCRTANTSLETQPYEILFPFSIRC